MAWPFTKDTPPNPDAAAPPPAGAPPPSQEKSPAELIAEALQPLVDKMGAFGDELKQVKESTKKPTPAANPTPGEPISVLEDENLAFNQRLTPILARQLELESRVVRDSIKNEYVEAGLGDTWQQFATEINATLDQSPLVSGDGKPLRGSPDYIRNVVDMILGRAARKAGMRFDGKSKGFFLESAGGDAGNGNKAAAEDGLSSDQRKVFSRMGVPLDQAKKTMAKLRFVS